MMTEVVKGKSVEEAEVIFTAFRQMITRQSGSDFEPDEILGDLEVLSGVSEFPARGQVRHPGVAHATLRLAGRPGRHLHRVGPRGRPLGALAEPCKSSR